MGMKQAERLGKSGEKLWCVLIIAVSSHDPGSREAEETIQAAMDAFLEKNLNHDQLANIITEIESKRTVLETA